VEFVAATAAALGRRSPCARNAFAVVQFDEVIE
jgi:hypothetical protein